MDSRRCWTITAPLTARSSERAPDELEEYTLDDKGYFGSGKMPKFTVEEGSKGMLAMGKKLGIKEGIRRRRLGHIPGVGAEDVVPGMDRVDL